MSTKTFQLNLQADRIEMVLAHHRLAAQVAGGVVTPRVVRFNISLGPSVKLNKLTALAEEIALALGAPSVRIQREGPTVQVEVPREDRTQVSLARLCAQMTRVPEATALLGMDTSGQPLLLRLASASVAHVLVAGTTGSGKTALMRAIVLSLARFNRPNGLRMMLIDPKGSAFDVFRDIGHLQAPPIRKIAEVSDALEKLVAQMERRACDGSDRPKVVVVIDELADLLQTGGRAVEQSLVRLLQRGREAGIHIIAATQKPSSQAMSSVMKSNFPTRLIG
ncbi:MAG: AAA family ATPase, partial [Chloroflexi bacterium]|nr:AAA family ATPase [Chloroflexota bacterium]